MCKLTNHMVAASEVCGLVIDQITHRKGFPSELDERNRLVIQRLEERHSDLVTDAKWDASRGEEAILVVIDQVFIRMDSYVFIWMIDLVGSFATFEQIEAELMLYEKYRYSKV